MKLYDGQADVLRKAVMGSGFSPAQLARAAGIPSSEVMTLLNGRISDPDQVVTKLAPQLSLDPSALIRLPDYEPMLTLPGHVSQITLPFENEEVNAWLITCGESVIVIDSGFNPGDLAAALEERNLNEGHLLITHGHRDHVGGIRAAAQLLGDVYAPVGVAEARTVEPGNKLRIGPLTIEVIDLKGHHPRAVGYLIDGLGPRLMAVGDAIFAGSIGGCPNPHSFARARETIKSAFSGSSPDLTLLPGHGPPTTLGKELTCNPFLAGWSSSPH